MAKTSVLLMSDTGTDLTRTGDPVRADGVHGSPDGIHTVTFELQDFTGRIYIEATLETEPTDGGWFPIYLTGGTPYVEYPRVANAPTGDNGDTMVDAFTFKGNLVWVRARLDKSYYVPVPSTDNEKALLGSITQILLNR